MSELHRDRKDMEGAGRHFTHTTLMQNMQLMGSNLTRSNNATMHMSHSLDEVAGSLVREALFPSSWQIYNTGQKINTFERPTTDHHTAAKKKKNPSL